MADRYTNLPFICLFVIVAWGISEATASRRYRRIVLATGAAAVLLACLAFSWGQAGYRRNSESLYIHAIRINSNNYIAYHHLGKDFTNQGKLDQAAAMYKKSIEVDASYSHAYNNLGIIYAKQGKFSEAVDNLKIAIRLNPTHAGFYRNLGLAYRQQGKTSEPEAVMEQVKWLSGKR